MPAKCNVFKQGLCIKCPANVFSSPYEVGSNGANDQGTNNKFVQCCVLGRTTYTATDGTSENCGAAFSGGAFTSNNQLDSVLKDSYKCTDASVVATTKAIVKGF